MATLNPFVENNKARINHFLNSLCEVGDFYDTLEVPCSRRHQTIAHPIPQMDQYMALSKKDMMIHITLNELYNTHSLILQHIEALVRFSPSRSVSHRSSSSSHRTTNSIYAF